MTDQGTPTPLSMSLAANPRTWRLGAAALFVGMVVFAVFATVLVVRSNDEQATLTADSDTEAVVTAIDDRMTAYTEVLYGVRSQFSPSTPSRDDFHRLIGGLELDSRYEGVQVIGAAHVVDRDELAGWESEIAAEAAAAEVTYPPFAVYPQTELDQALPIDFIEPTEGNEQAFGLDFFSEPNRRAAAERARDTGEPAATAPITLVQETGEQRAILVMLPVYASGLPPADIDARRAEFTGVVYAAFRMGDLLSAALDEDGSQITEVTDIATGETLFSSDTVPDDEAAFDDSLILDVAGRQWAVGVHVEDSALSPLERLLPLIVLLGGLSIAALVAGLISAIASSRSKAVGLAREMTTELEAITEAAAEAIISADSSGQIVAWNRGATDIFGAEAHEMLGRSLLDLVPDRFHATFRHGMNALLVGESDRLVDTSVDLIGRRHDGEEFPLELSVSRWNAHDEVFLTGFVRDVTERVESRQRLQQTTELLVAMLGAATEMSIIATDLDGTITVFNRGAELMLGYDSDEVVGQHTPALIHDPDETAHRAAQLGIDAGFEVFVHAARRGLPETREWSYVRRDGSRLPVELTVTAMYDSEGETTGFIGIAVDITERRRSEQAQRDALAAQKELVDKLTELDRAKSDFVSTASHELRTPLTSIIGFSEILGDQLEASGDEGDRELVGMIERNAERLLTLVEDLLALSRIESGSFRLHQEPLDAEPLLAGTCEAVRPLAAERGIELVYSRDSDRELTIDGDRPQLERVFLNLLTNAVKFSHDGGSVRALAWHDGDEVVVSVEDDGIGIPADEQDQLFSRFFRSRTAEDVKGTGLGLAIVDSIVERHRGTVQVRSTEGVGTTVEVRFPAASVDGRSTQLEEATT